MSNRITFYSVSPVGNTTDMKVTANITISGGVATLTAAQTGNIGAGCRIEYNSTHTYIAPNRIGFDSGGTTEIKIGDKIEGGTSSATGIVRAVHISSGTWGGGDCAGHIYFEKTTGTWQDNEQINRVKPTSSSNVGTTDGMLEGNIGNGNTEFVVLTATGADAGNQTSVSVDHIYHEYGSLALWEAGFTDSNHLNTTDLTTNGDTTYACCYYDHNNTSNYDDTQLQLLFGTTGGSGTGNDIVYIFTPTGESESINRQRHSGKRDTSKHMCTISDEAYGFFKMRQSGVRVEGIQLDVNSTGGDASYGWYTASNETGPIVIENCIFTEIGSPIGDNNAISGYDDDTTVYVVNTVIDGFRGYGIFAYYDYYIYNCVIRGDGSNDRGIRQVNGTTTVKNSAVFYNSDDFYNVSSGNITTSASDDADTAINPSDWSTVFVNPSSHDFTIKATDTDLKDAGTDLSTDNIYAFWRDIAGNERGSTPDIGAFEYMAVGGGVTVPIFMSNYLRAMGA